ncbi:hypothetical protein SARC_14254 [Sphaeroforma arctica JP610]|uniref:Uncharacterized protein n=1 Tax=Sphaeroforma arctica JP610 TaxID=667725 RepID=A0A0L0F8Z2_9EUKA|nr:hypothetical protein SARC_14254 [Sphaeroforma arctica JP610]KNC73187.1 hypothetical protein SARC_14254 [Sphaeroforma arctica JP610]|eukprot:XP_014147089.1 hypothetical protein SARC_14254 [Sphaeroforma arctica JP610]
MKQAQGWARRRPHGEQHDQSYMKKYVDDIKEIFHKGEADSSLKMQPGSMLSQLKLMYPGQYSLPNEMNIRTLISTLTSAKKAADAKRKTEIAQAEKEALTMAAAAARGEEYVSAAGKKARKKTIAFPKLYQTDMENILEDNTDIRWQEAIPLMKE